MSNYSHDPASVRVDFFKSSGKWYETEAVVWTGGYNGDIHNAFEETLKTHLKGRMAGMTAVCLEPYHKNAHPLMVTVPGSTL